MAPIPKHGVVAVTGAAGYLGHRDVGLRVGERVARGDENPLAVALGVDASGRCLRSGW